MSIFSQRDKLNRIPLTLNAIILLFVLMIFIPQRASAVAPTMVTFPLTTGKVWTMSTYAGHGSDIGAAKSSIDIHLKNGIAEGYDVFAMATGTVVANDASNGQITIKVATPLVTTNDAVIGSWYYTYAHMKNISVSKGSKVTAGQKVGQVSHVGKASDPHLHITISSADNGVAYYYNNTNYAISPYYVYGLVDANGNDLPYMIRDKSGPAVTQWLINHKPQTTASQSVINSVSADGSEMTTGGEQVLPDGDYIITNAAYTGKPSEFYLDFQGVASTPADNTNAILTGPVINDEVPVVDVWTLTYLHNGFYKITQKGTNMALSVHDASVKSGANVSAHEFASGKNEQWEISFNTVNGYRIRARHSGFYLDVSGGSMTNGANVQQNSGNGTGSQAWLFIPYMPSQPVENGRYMIVSSVDQSLVLDVAGESADIAQNTKVQIWHDDSQYNSFDFAKLSNGYYTINHHASGKVLEVYGGVSTRTDSLSLHTPNGSSPQQWAIVPNGENGEYCLVCQCSGYAMDLAQAATADGSLVRQNPWNGSPAETWYLYPAEYTVVYDANGGTGVPENQIGYYNQDLILTTDIPTREGFEFVGWGVIPESEVDSFQPGDLYDWKAGITLYAVWRSYEPPTEYVLRVNGWLDNTEAESTDGFGSFDVYVDGELIAEGVTSFERVFPENVQYEIKNIHPAPGKKYNGTQAGSLTGSMPYGNAKVTLAFSTVIDISEEWQETNVLPEDIDLTGFDIEYKNHYTYWGRTSPGEEWTLAQEGIIQYEEDGNPIESDNPMETSETLKLLGHFYFHYCNNSPVASYEWKTTRPNRHIITMEDAKANYTVEYYAMDGTRKAYRLKHKSGQWAGGYATCRTNGSEIYYEGDVYQRYKTYQINEYTRESEWTDTVDPEASFVTYRIRIKNDYIVTFDNNGGIFDVQILKGHVGEKIKLPENMPYRMGYAFTCWSLTADGTGEGWVPGGYIVSEENKTLIAQWRKLDALILPDDVLEIEEDAFVSVKAEYVRIPDGCTSIGNHAFKDCDHLKQIRIPENCMIGTDAFDGCSDMYIFGVFGSPAEWYCLNHSNCTFVSE